MAPLLDKKVNNLIQRANDGTLNRKRAHGDMRTAKDALGSGLITADTYRALQKQLLKLECEALEKQAQSTKKRG